MSYGIRRNFYNSKSWKTVRKNISAGQKEIGINLNTVN